MTHNSQHPVEPIPLIQNLSSSSLVSGIFFFLVMILCFGNTIYEVSTDKLNLFPGEISKERFLSGKTTADIATALKKTGFSEKSAQLQRLSSWTLFRDLGPEVREGTQGWLFLSDEFVIHENAVASVISKTDEVKRVEKLLADKGTTLFVLLIPDKSRVQSEQLGNLKRSESLISRVNFFEQNLLKSKVNVLNVTDIFLEKVKVKPLFLKADTHWSESGAQLAATAIGQTLLDGKCQPMPKMEVISNTELRNRSGDLVKLAGLDWLSADKQPALDYTEFSTFVYKPISSTSSNVVDDLFGDKDLPNIALIGTSYSNNSHFSDFLGKALKTKVGNFAKDGGDFAGSMSSYLRSSSFKETPPSCLIWEIPERVIQNSKNRVE
ncbi:alginate O-acetyltransferase AlgX-related protein [Polynucleobacter rarus]|uniref:alginate O-acetyltransferase AlgX-related protein n=1 Tax=Polynucleobacter rarus TaxID=556055 RepID=UPI000D3EBDF4|nr:cell division protein FtsQ [Polynucleobacter rarus]